MKHKILIFIATLLIISCGADQAIKKGDKFTALGEYFEASEQYKKAYRQTPPKEKVLRGKRALKLAQSYEKINYTQKSIAAYRNAIRYGQNGPEQQIALAKLLLQTNGYKEATAIAEAMTDSMQLPKYKALKDSTKNPLFDMLPAILESAKNAPEMKAVGSRYTVKKMDVFNSRRADYCPMLTGDAYDKLYFTSTRNDAQGDELSGITGMKFGDIFVSEKDEKGQWKRPETIESGLNTELDEGACSFTPDGGTMYLTQCKTDPSYPRYAEIATSKRSDAAWSATTKLEISKDTLSSFAHPAISPDGQWLYFCSDMPGGHGGKDIWRIRIGQGGIGGVENLGEPINTPGDEMFPTFRPNGDLYFSSNGKEGFGGLDIYIAKVDKLTRRYVVEHPGYPLNSQGDDFGMTFDGVHNRGFFSSNRGDARGYDHIFSFDCPEIIQTVKGWVYEMDGYELPAADVYIIGSDGTNQHTSVKSDGSFTFVAKSGTEYIFQASCPGYMNSKESVTIPKNPQESEEFVLQFPLPPINIPVLIDNIFYDYAKWTLRPESNEALDKLAELLKQNPNVTIELSSHCDYRGGIEFNRNLSQKRAESVVEYLISKGIAADRLTPVGYGKEKPKTVRKKLAEKYDWLKDGDILTEDFIRALKNEEKEEICNELNRRTEFIVLRTTYDMFDEEGNLKYMPKSTNTNENEEENEDGFEIVF